MKSNEDHKTFPIVPIPFGFSLLRHFGTTLFNFWNYFLWLRITNEGSVPKMRIWSILLFLKIRFFNGVYILVEVSFHVGTKHFLCLKPSLLLLNFCLCVYKEWRWRFYLSSLENISCLSTDKKIFSDTFPTLSRKNVKMQLIKWKQMFQLE